LFPHRNPYPVWPETGKGFAAAYGEAVIPQGESEPAGLAVAAYASGVDQDE